MSLSTGTRLGPYEILTPLGAGGMGEVYKARDSRLDRTVAIKVLPEHLSQKPQLRERFEREARAVSSLNHSNICTLHDVGQQNDVDYLVMEYLEGDTLAQRLKKGPLPLGQALRYAVEIAGALDHAHRHGVVHRDLKPSNIMLTKAGAKVLDFGLAKVHAVASTTDVTQPTNTMTAEGVILGTLQYMAPEQLAGDEADARSDIFAFGAVVYEMATGKKAFEGKSRASVIAAILERESPPLISVDPMTPAALDRVVKKCLAKDPDRRWQTAQDLRDELQWIAERGSTTETRSVSPGGRLGWVVAGLLTLALVVGGTVWRVARTNVAPQPVVRLSIPIAAATPSVVPALSRDGTRLVYATGRNPSRLYQRPLDRFEATQIRGTEGGIQPFLSPDGLWVGFWTEGKLKKVPLSGGVVQTLCPVTDSAGADWATDDSIYFGTPSTGLWRVPAAGGKPVAVTTLDQKKGELSHRWPQLVPGGKAILFTVQGPDPSDFHIAVELLATHERRSLTEKGSYAQYASSGHLVYEEDTSLLARPFDLGRLETTGPEFPVLENLRSPLGGAQFALSASGVLVYALGGGPEGRDLVWVDRRGTATPLPAPKRGYSVPQLSPDGQRLAIGIFEGLSRSDVWTYDLVRGVLARVTSDGRSHSPIWSPDGSRLVYGSSRVGSLNLLMQVADGSSQAERLVPSEYAQWPGSISPDGRMLAFMQDDPATLGDIWVLPLQGEHKPQPFLRKPFYQYGARISPDGQWLAYTSNETGRYEVYVTAFPSGRGKWQISTEGGGEVLWAKNGRELFWRDGDKMMSAGVDAKSSFSAAKPTLLFAGYARTSGIGLPGYDVSADGRFLMVKASEAESAPAQLNVILNWFDELKNRTSGQKK